MMMMEKSLSQTFNVLRFPLAVLVVYLHIAPMPDVDTWGALSEFTHEEAVYKYVVLMVSVIARCAVPLFFFMSAYLIGMQSNRLSIDSYKQRLKKRFFSLVVPYVVWNIAAALYLKYFVKTPMPWSEVFISPVNFPLWFLRNLIVLNICYPIFVISARYGKWILGCFLFGLYMFCGRFELNENTMVTIFYFYIGIYVGMNVFPISQVNRRYRYLIVILAVILYAVYVGMYPTVTNEMMIVLTLVMCGAVMTTAYEIVDKHDLRPMEWLAGGSFFIYLSHKVGATFAAKKLFMFLPQDSLYTQSIIFLLAPLLTVLICLCLYRLMNRILPRTARLINGGK